MSNKTTFPFFSLLPLELRNLIWEFALPPQRSINFPIFAPIPTLPHSANNSPFHLHKVPPPTNDPATLRVCHESRAIALKFYTLRKHFCSRASNFVNFDRDAFALDWNEIKTRRHILQHRRTLSERQQSQSQVQGSGYEGFRPGLLNASKEDFGRIRHLVLDIGAEFYYATDGEWWLLNLCMKYILPLFTGLRTLVIGVIREAKVKKIYLEPTRVAYLERFLKFVEEEEDEVRREWLKSVLVVE